MKSTIKWFALFTIVSSILAVAFNDFLPKFFEWQERFPPEPDPDDPEAQPVQNPVPEAVPRLVDPLGMDTFQSAQQGFEKGL